MVDEKEGEGAKDGRSSGTGQSTRPQRAGEAATTRFGMEDGDAMDVPATGLDAEQQSDASGQAVSDASTKPKPSDPDEVTAEDEAARLGDFA